MDAIFPTLPDRASNYPPIGHDHALSLANHLVYLYSTHTVTDISVKCGDETFELHSPVLSHGSGYFRRVLANDSSEITLEFTPSIEASVFRIIVESLYTGHVENITEDNVTQVLEASCNMQVQLAMDACVEYMLRHLDLDNCLRFWLSARYCDVSKIQREAIELIGRHLSKISRMPTFLTLQSNIVMDILGHDKLQVSSEVEVYEAAMAWLKCDPESRKYDLSRLLDVIRLPLLPVDYLVNVVGKEDLIEENSEAMRKYSQALKAQLGGESKLIKARHNVIHGMRGEYEKVAKSVRVNMVRRKDHCAVPLAVTGGVFSRCCIPEDSDEVTHHDGSSSSSDPKSNALVEFGVNIQGGAEKVGKGVQNGAKKIGDGVQGIISGLGATLKKASEKITNPETFDNLKKRQVGGFWLDVTNNNNIDNMQGQTDVVDDNEDGEKLDKDGKPKTDESDDNNMFDLSRDEELQQSFSLRDRLDNVPEGNEEDLSDTTAPVDMEGLSEGTPPPSKLIENQDGLDAKEDDMEDVQFDEDDDNDLSMVIGEDLIEFLDNVTSQETDSNVKAHDLTAEKDVQNPAITFHV